jgi:hypothetical protein
LTQQNRKQNKKIKEIEEQVKTRNW